jgi:hypothetical protein
MQMLPFATIGQKLALLPEGAMLGVWEYVPVTWDRSTGKVMAWDVHGGRPLADNPWLKPFDGVETVTPEEFAALMPPFFVWRDHH